MKINWRRLLNLSLCLILAFSLTPSIGWAKAETSSKAIYKEKDEVIYGKLNSKGSIHKLYVVNSFYGTTEGLLTDYGSYSNLRNLTDLQEIKSDHESVSFETAGEDFYYQGELTDLQLPWQFQISYFLDGKEIEADQLAGESGRLDIHIDVKQNEEIDPIFSEYYLLQISLSLDPLHAHDITAPKGSEANEGKNKLINFTVMPGEEDLLITTANVENFTLEAISISAIPANLAFDDPDLSDMEADMKKLSDAIQELHEGVLQLYHGVSDLESGSEQLAYGSQQFLQGMQELNKSSEDLIEGSQQIKDALWEINQALDIDMDIDLPDEADILEVAEIIRGIGEELEAFLASLKDMDELLEDLTASNLTEDDFEKLYMILEDYGATEDVYDTLQELVLTYQTVQALSELNDLSPIDLGELAQEMLILLDEAANELEDNLNLLDDLAQFNELIEGLRLMAEEYDQFHQGLIQYTKGVGSLTENYGELDQAIDNLSGGTSQVKDGVKDLLDGTGELHEATKDLPQDMQSELESFMEDFDFSDFEPKSFVSDKNKRVGVVQFVLQTEAIKLPEIDEVAETEVEEKNLWQRFLDLFR